MKMIGMRNMQVEKRLPQSQCDLYNLSLQLPITTLDRLDQYIAFKSEVLLLTKYLIEA